MEEWSRVRSMPADLQTESAVTATLRHLAAIMFLQVLARLSGNHRRFATDRDLERLKVIPSSQYGLYSVYYSVDKVTVYIIVYFTSDACYFVLF